MSGQNIIVKKNDISFTVEDSFELQQYVDYNFWSDIYPDWEHSTFKVLDSFLAKDKDYLDIGAWVGPTVLYSSFIARNVIAVEPDPVAYKIVNTNLKINNINNVHVINKAASSLQKVSVQSHSFYGDSMTRTVADLSAGIEVSTIGIDELLNMGDFSLIKIDIEGYEFDLIPDYAQVLNEAKVPLLVSLHSPFVDNHEDKLTQMLGSLVGIKNVFDESGNHLKINQVTSGFGSYLFIW